MSILIDKDTRIIVQGITGTQASFHVRRSIEYGTNIIGGVTPGKGGSFHLGVPVFDTVSEAVKETGATASVIFVPAKFVVSAVKEAMEAGIEIMVIIADNVPIRDMIRVKEMLKGTGIKLIGPNTPGIITPGESRMGIFPENIHTPGRIGVVSRSSTLTYEAVLEINRAGMGQSTVVGLGDDIVIGAGFVEIVSDFMKDDDTDAIVVIGTLGGRFEEQLAQYYESLENKKPMVSFVAGNNLSYRYNIGYAGDIITKGQVTAQDKKDVMIEAGIVNVDHINLLHKELLNMIK